MSFTTTRRALTAAAAAIAISAGLSAAPAGAQDSNFILATASTGGTYYPVGVAISTLTKVRLEPSTGISLNAISSAGSGENVRLLRENEAQFAILQGLFGAWAWNGTGAVEADGPQEHLRSVSMLWQNVEHFVVTDDNVSTGTVADFVAMEGGASLGRRNSGTIGSNTHILSGFGVDIEDQYDLVYVGYGPSADALQNGQIDGMSTPAGVPVSAVTRAFAARDDITLLGFTDEQVATANGDIEGLWTPYVIPAETYPGQDEDVTTIAQPNFLATRADLDDEAVYQVVKTMYENLPFLNNIHAATRAMSVEAAIAGLPMPLHPGAARYYREMGVDIPDRLIAD